MSANGLTVIRAAGKRLTKLHRPGESVGYDGVYLVGARPVTGLEGVRDLSARLTTLGGRRDSAVVRGDVRPDQIDKPLIRRAKYDDPDKGVAGLTPCDRCWLLNDIDDLLLPDERLVTDDPEWAIIWTLSQLDPWLQGVTCHWQWSASAGVKSWRVIKAHIWIWLNRPVDDASLRNWAQNAQRLGTPVDPSLMESVQIHYTADPVFEGRPDPVLEAGLSRSMLIEGQREEAVVPEAVWDWSRREQERRERARRERGARVISVPGTGDVARYTAGAIRGMRSQLVGTGCGQGAHDVAKAVAGSLANLVVLGWLDETTALEVLHESPINDVPRRDGELRSLWQWTLARAESNPPEAPELHGSGGEATPGGRAPDPPPLGDKDAPPGGDRGGEEASQGGKGGDEPQGGGGGARLPVWPMTDLGNAERLLYHHGPGVRYLASHRRWYLWDGARWAWDECGEIEERAKQVARSIRAEAEGVEDNDELRQRLRKWGPASESAGRLTSMVHLARTHRTVARRVEDFDQDPWALNVQNGTLDLSTGRMSPHRAEDLLSRICPVPYDAGAICPTWDAFLLASMDGRQHLVDFLQRAAGYSLTGDAREECLFLLHGHLGRNGKGTFVGTLQRVLGDYQTTASFDTFLARSSVGVRNDLAKLDKVRLVMASEPNQGAKLDEGLVKTLTGRDVVTARFLYGEEFTFQPQFKLWLMANHKPLIRGTDGGIWSRIRLVPFEVSFWGREDKTLKQRLQAELPGILAWCVRGCVAWQREGLCEPAEVLEGTQAYRDEMDVVGAFLSECTVSVAGARTPMDTLFKSWEAWCDETGEHALSKIKLGKALRERGLADDRVGATRYWKDIGLLEGVTP